MFGIVGQFISEFSKKKSVAHANRHKKHVYVKSYCYRHALTVGEVYGSNQKKTTSITGGKPEMS